MIWLFFHTWPTLGPSPGVHMHPSAEMNLKVQASGRSKTHYSILCVFSHQVLSLCDLMGCSMPGLPVLHYLPEFTQTHVHRVSDATQPSHPLSSPSPPAFNLSQHQGLFSSIVILFFIYWSVVDVLGKLQVYNIVIHNFKGYIPFTVILKYCLFSPCYTHACSLFYTTVCAS